MKEIPFYRFSTDDYVSTVGFDIEEQLIILRQEPEDEYMPDDVIVLNVDELKSLLLLVDAHLTDEGNIKHMELAVVQ